MIVRHLDRIIIAALLCLVLVILWLLFRSGDQYGEVVAVQPTPADAQDIISRLDSIPVHLHIEGLFQIGGAPLSCAPDSELGEWRGSKETSWLNENLSPKDFSIRSAHAEIKDRLVAIHIHMVNVSAQVKAWPLFRTIILSDRGVLLADFTKTPMDYDSRWLPGCTASPGQQEEIVFVHELEGSIGPEISVFIGVCSYPRKGGRIECLPDLDQLSSN